jgi:murein DD-endopeptidase MepM/ murein hydrolase activator NlpD
MTLDRSVRDALRARDRKAGPARIRRLGVLDLVLTFAILAFVATRTPVGSLVWYGVERLRGHERDLPTLTAFFDSGAVAPPLPTELHLPPVAPATPGQLPEPWRTGAVTLLTAEVPAALGAVTPPGGDAVAAALAVIDAEYAREPDPAWTLEVAAVGREVAERAVERAAAAGEAEPRRFAAHRRFLPPAAAREADRFVGGVTALATALDFAWPLAVPHRLTSPFGERLHPTLKVRKNHTGVDLGVPIGTPVLSAQAGRLAVVGESGVSGKYVVVDHGFGVRTSYCHLSETPLKQGGHVERGDEIAKSGNTGRSTGPHLHYGVAIAGRWVDPERFRPSAAP